LQTGAFEVYLGGRLLHSKIKTGVLPDFDELVRVIGAELDGRARVNGK
jgi:selT/selW/selH-like putative selenoprotein